MRNASRALWIAAALTVLAGCSHASKTAQSPQNRPSAAARSAPTPGAAQRPAPVPSRATGTMGPSPSPAGASAPKAPTAPPLAVKKVPRVAPDAKPQILDVAVSETDVRPGDRVFGEVVTSSNVASVEARIGGYAVSLAKVGVGRFQLLYTVGPLPWFVHGNFTMQVIARNTRGDSATRAVPLTVR